MLSHVVRDFGDVIKDLEMGSLLDYPGGPNVITRVKERGRQESQSKRQRCDNRSRCQNDAGP